MDRREQEKERTERLRGWIIYLIYKARPRTLELDSLQRLLDKRNLPVTKRRLAEELDYLRSLRLLKMYGRADAELDEPQQSRLIQRYADSDREEAAVVSAALTAAGINYQEELDSNLSGIARVE